MEDKRNLHLKVQEMCDCYVTTDPLKGMSEIPSDSNTEEAAIKWLALAAIHAVTDGAKKISLHKGADGKVTVLAKYREAELPSPGPEIGEKVIEILRRITHMEGEKSKSPLALGIRNDSLEIDINMETDKQGETVQLKFPE